MGATLQTMTTFSTNKDQIRSDWQKAVEDSRDQDGSSYSGSIGMFDGQRIQFQDSPPLAEILEADEWLADNHNKYSPPMAVRFVAEDGKTKWMIGGWVSE